MSDGQIWVAIILGFIVLISLVGVVPSVSRRGKAPWPIAQASDKGLHQRLDALAEESADIKQRLASIERMLKEVE